MRLEAQITMQNGEFVPEKMANCVNKMNLRQKPYVQLKNIQAIGMYGL